MQDNNGCTLVHWSAYMNNVFLLKFYKRLGMDLHTKDKTGATPLQRALSNHAMEAIEFLAKDMPSAITDQSIDE